VPGLVRLGARNDEAAVWAAFGNAVSVAFPEEVQAGKGELGNAVGRERKSWVHLALEVEVERREIGVTGNAHVGFL
jgi:hypothetical protein